MAWRAVFVDGPLAGVDHDRMFMGAWQRELHFAPLPAQIAASSDGWVLVGLESFNDHWPGQVTYVRNDERSSLIKDEDWQPGQDEGFAIYEVSP